MMIGPFTEQSEKIINCLIDEKIIELEKVTKELSDLPVDHNLSTIESRQLFICLLVGIPFAILIIVGSIYLHKKSLEPKVVEKEDEKEVIKFDNQNIKKSRCEIVRK